MNLITRASMCSLIFVIFALGVACNEPSEQSRLVEGESVEITRFVGGWRTGWVSSDDQLYPWIVVSIRNNGTEELTTLRVELGIYTRHNDQTVYSDTYVTTGLASGGKYHLRLESIYGFTTTQWHQFKNSAIVFNGGIAVSMNGAQLEILEEYEIPYEIEDPPSLI